jgi:hypothetical protein
MNSRSAKKNLFGPPRLAITAAWACLSIQVLLGAQQASTGQQPPAAQTSTAAAVPRPVEGETFATPQQAADALIAAAGTFDEASLAKIFGPNGKKIIFTEEAAQDRERALGFAAEAKEKMTVSIDPKTGKRAFVIVGDEEWPFPVPVVKVNGKWSFDAKAGERELLYRRIGANELDAIEISHGFVEAQEDYAFRSRSLYNVNQYAQRIVSTPGKQDGLAWQTADGKWEGPIGEEIAKSIAQGYSPGEMPYHGYFFKVLKGQGPAAPLGQLDYVIEGVMIGGFALVSAPAQYRVTGVKTFMVSNDGVIYEKDLGPDTLEQFRKMERFNPDSTWQPVLDK